MSRPEHLCPPELFYDAKEASKYDQNSRMVKIQQTLSERAIELLNIPEGAERFLLDVGCGSGLSGHAIEEAGHAWVGFDISPNMLEIAAERDSSGDVFLQDMGNGMPFRAGIFDGCISISAIQWLCYSDKSEHASSKRLLRFFSALYYCLKRGARAVLQFYPETSEQLELISNCAMKSGFSGGLVVDFPNSAKAKKYFLCLNAGVDNTAVVNVPVGLGMMESAAPFAHERNRSKKKRGGRESVKAKDWIMAKKTRQRKQGKEVKRDSKFTGRRRPGAF